MFQLVLCKHAMNLLVHIAYLFLSLQLRSVTTTNLIRNSRSESTLASRAYLDRSEVPWAENQETMEHFFCLLFYCYSVCSFLVLSVLLVCVILSSCSSWILLFFLFVFLLFLFVLLLLMVLLLVAENAVVLVHIDTCISCPLRFSIPIVHHHPCTSMTMARSVYGHGPNSNNCEIKQDKRRVQPIAKSS